MKKTLVPSLFLALALGACTTERIVEVEKTTPTTKYVAPDTTSGHQIDGDELDTRFMNNITADFPYEVSKLGKTNTLELGHLVCGAIDDGSTLQDFVDIANKTGVDAGFIGAVIREAVHNFCPENQWFIDSALNA